MLITKNAILLNDFYKNVTFLRIKTKLSMITNGKQNRFCLYILFEKCCIYFSVKCFIYF